MENHLSIFDRLPDVEVKFIFNGFKKKAIYDGYHPMHLISDNYLTTGLHHYYDLKYVEPTGTAFGTITFITPEAYPNTLKIGSSIPIYEGEYVIGYAIVTKVFNRILCS